MIALEYSMVLVLLVAAVVGHLWWTGRTEGALGALVFGGLWVVATLLPGPRPRPTPPPRDPPPPRDHERKAAEDELAAARAKREAAASQREQADRLNNRRRGFVARELVATLAVIAALVALALALQGCKSPPRAALTWSELSPIVEPAPPPVIERPGDCPRVESLVIGERPPFVAGGVAECSAQVIPLRIVDDLEADGEELDYWRELTDIERREREDDRTYCAGVVSDCRDEAARLERETRAARIRTALGASATAVTAFLLGLFLGGL